MRDRLEDRTQRHGIQREGDYSSEVGIFHLSTSYHLSSFHHPLSRQTKNSSVSSYDQEHILEERPTPLPNGTFSLGCI